MRVEELSSLGWEGVQKIPAQEIRDGLLDWLREFEPPCIVHPHGFHVVLLHSQADMEWRLHMWARGTRSISGMPTFIHTHNREVRSRVLRGRLTNIQYEVDSSQNHGHPLYSVEYLGNKYEKSTLNVLRRTSDRVRVIEISKVSIEDGDSYHVPRHSFHEAVVSDDIVTCTIVCMSDPESSPIYVVGADGYPDEISFERTASSVQAVIDGVSMCSDESDSNLIA
jgi:hypothetical protein